MKKCRRAMSIMISAVMCCTALPIPVSSKKNEAVLGTLDISFSDNAMEYTIEQPEEGSLKSKTYRYDNTGSSEDTDVLPEKYSAADCGVVTPVKDQKSSTACWAFSAAACAEHYLVSNGMENNTVDLSEAALTWFSLNTAIGGSEGTVYDDAFREGGNWIISALAMSRLSGIEYEDFEPFNDGKRESIDISDLQRDVCEYQLKSVRSIPADNSGDIKKAVMENGGVSVSYNTNDEYFSADNESYFNPDGVKINHTVTIIGWDDSYSRYNFDPAHIPSKDGAWLVKGSWGNFSHDGCYFISYEEPELKYFCAYELEDNSCADSVYTHTYGTGMVATYAESGIKGGNIFTAEKDEILKKVSFLIMNTKGEDVSYSVDVYKSPSDTSPENSQRIAGARGTVSCDGYYSVGLDSNPEIKAGEKFSVVLTLDYSGKYSYIICEGGKNSSSSKGESFIESNGIWYDCKTSGYNNIYINAYTSNTEPADKSGLEELIEQYENTPGLFKETENARTVISDENASVCDIRNAYLLLRSAAEKAGSALVISDYSGWCSFAQRVNAGESFSGKNVLLESNIDFEGKEFIPAGIGENGFEGCFDGNGFIFSNINYEDPLKNAGVFGRVTGSGCIKNLTVTNSFFSGIRAGGIAADFEGDSIVGCVFNGTVIGENTCGSIAADLAGGYVQSCYINEKYGAFGECPNGMVYNLYSGSDMGYGAYMLNTSGGVQKDSRKWTSNDNAVFQCRYGSEPAHKIVFNAADAVYESFSDENGLAEFPVPEIPEDYTLRWYKNGEEITSEHRFTENCEVSSKLVIKGSFAVKYELDGGDNAPENPEFILPEETAELFDPQKEDNIFAGWYTDSEFAGEPVTQLANVSSDVVLYAKWDAITYKVTFLDAYGNEIDVQSVKKGESAKAPKAPDVKGLIFAGWDGGFDSVTNDITVSAVYTVGAADISLCTVSGIEECVYDGDHQMQDNISVSIGNVRLTEGVHYAISYANNVSAGSAFVIVRGIGKCFGVRSVMFKITSAEVTDASIGSIFTRTYTGKAICPSVKLNSVERTYEYGKDYTVEYSNNINAGEAVVKVIFKGNYKGEISKNFYILPESSKDLSYDSDPSFVYSGNEIMPEVTILDDGVPVIQDRDYDVRYVDNLETGLARAFLTFKGNYQGVRIVYFTILPQRTKLVYAEGSGNGELSAHWEKLESVNGYQIVYAESPDFKGMKYKTFAGSDIDSGKITGLESGKTYYVKVRAYTQLNERVKGFGEYSDAMTVTV